jgi:hypothetical protein
MSFVGRHSRNSLTPESISLWRTQEDPLFVGAQAARVARETRLAAWDLKERFRVAMEERSLKVKGAEEMECRAVRVREWFATVMHRSADICEQTDLVTLSGRHIYTEVRHQLNPPLYGLF